MSYPQLGYSYSSPASSSISASQLLVPGAANPSSLTTSTSNGSPTCPLEPRPLTSDPSTPPTPTTQGVYTSGLLNYPARMAGLSETMSTLYNTAYATQGYVPFGADPSAFYSPLGTNNTEAWRNLSQGGAWPYDPTMAAYPYSAGYGGLDVRRKNATREATSTLKAWLYEHIKNPYPTKGEKIMLAIITKMTLTQVSTWFANARRRLKKENKMQWSPRNRTGDDDDDDKDDSDVEGDNKEPGDVERGKSSKLNADDKDDEDEDIIVDGCSSNDNLRLLSPGGKSDDGSLLDLRDTSNPLDSNTLHNTSHGSVPSTPSSESNTNNYINISPNASDPKDPLFSLSHQQQHHQKDSMQNSSSQNKPRIWSMADMATPSQPQIDRRSPTAIAQSLISKSGYTAFSSPTSHGGHPHPALNGSYHGLTSSSAPGTGLSPYRLSYMSNGTSATPGMLPNFHRPTSINALPPAPSSCSQRLSAGVLGAPLDGARIPNISANSLENTATAFKPVPRRS